MFDWIDDLIDAISDAISEAFELLGTQISNTIWNTMLRWMYDAIYGAVADFFTLMGNMGADIFDLDWVQATIKLFTLFGWSLFIAGMVVAIFDVAIEYQHGRADIKTTSINILKGFFACSLIGVVPVELYKFCISLQNTFSHDLSRLFASGQSLDLSGQSTSVLMGSFSVANNVTINLFNILSENHSHKCEDQCCSDAEQEKCRHINLSVCDSSLNLKTVNRQICTAAFLGIVADEIADPIRIDQCADRCNQH